MCLETITSRKPKVTGFGYKVFQKRDGELIGDCKCIGSVRKVGEKIYSKDISAPFEVDHKLETFDGSKYASGFHIFKTITGAADWIGARQLFKTITGAADWIGARQHKQSRYSTIRKVEYYKAKVEGMQLGYDIVVAKCIKIYPQDITVVSWKQE